MNNNNDWDKGAATGINPWYLCIICGIVLLFSFTIIAGLKHETADEGFHTPVIFSYFNGNFIVSDNIAMLPVYHAVMAGIMRLFNHISVESLRFANLVVSALCLPAFYQICRTLGRHAVAERTLMFLLTPVILPFFSLIYTDMIATLLVLGMILFMLRDRHLCAGLLGLAAVFFRQTNLLWVGFCGLYMIVAFWVVQDSPYRQRALELGPRLFKRLLPYGLVVVIFGGFVIYNGGVAIGTADLQQVSFNPSNVYFFLLLGFFLFWAYNFEYVHKVYRLLATSANVWVFIGVFFLVYFATYSNSHQFNAYGLSFYIRNIVLHHTVTNVPVKILTFIPVCWMALTFFVMARESEKPWQLYVLYFVIFINLVPLPLVEQRYYMVGLILFLAFKPQSSDVSDRLIIASYVPVSAFLLFGISKQWFFL